MVYAADKNAFFLIPTIKMCVHIIDVLLNG